MFSVVIADDNRRSCEGIRRIIENSFPQLEIKGIFYNGLDLKAFIQAQDVNIIITDIHMHGLDGLEATKEAAQRSEVIAVTGYQLFEYAKRALDYRIPHFIVKPYASGTLVAAIEECIQALESRKEEQAQSAVHYLNKWQLLKNHAEAVLAGASDSADHLEAAKLFCESASVADAPCCVLEYQSDITGCTEAFDHDSQVVVAFTADAQSLVFYRSEEGLRHYLLDIAYFYSFGHEDSLKYAIRYFEDLRSVCAWCKMKLLFSQKIKNALANFTEICEEDISGLSLRELQHLLDICAEYRPAVRELQQGASASDREDLIRFLLALPQQLPLVSKPDRLLSAVIQLIGKNYSNPDFSLSDMARDLGISYTYLSKIFKSAYQTTLLAYLTNFRLERARQLLEQTDKNISEISHKVGYLKTPHFRSLFFEKYDTTPSEYRLKFRSTQDGCQNK